MKSPFDLSGRHILITGGSSGIGRAAAVLCAQQGATVTLGGRDEERLQQSLSLLDGEGHDLMCCDLTHPDKVKDCVAQLTPLDGVVHAAGVQLICPTRNITDEAAQMVFDTNYHAAVRLTTDLLAQKKIRRGASLVFISSVAAGRYAEMGNAIYSSSKAALASYARVLALELSHRSIRVNTVSPAMVRTPMVGQFELTPEQLASDEQKYPLGYGRPEDVAATVAFLLSDGARWMTGSDLLIDGGLTLR
jgi:NAD(P)-dependent dehydrogenase (short-subunit alcohol dehydrogenase family)